jgi:hypothetical protein
MRNLLTLLCIFICLAACKKSSNNLPVTVASLSGRWVRESATTITYQNSVQTNSSTTAYPSTTNAANPPNLVIAFITDLSGTYSEPNDASVSFSYIITGNQLSLDYGLSTDLPTGFTVKSLTSTHLELVNGSSTGDGTVYDVTYFKN